MVGKTISHYKVLEKIGEGGMGEVYRVTDTKLQPGYLAVPLLCTPKQDKHRGRTMRIENRGQLIAEVSGKPANIKFNTYFPGIFGRTTMQLFPQRVVEATKRLISSRNSEILVSEVDSVEMLTQGNPTWLWLGFLTIALFGLGIIFFVLYVVVKQKLLVVHSKSNIQVLALKLNDDETLYQQFMESVLEAAEGTKKNA